MFEMLVGKFFGPDPEKMVDRIKGARKKCAEYVVKAIGLTKSDVVLEIGSGCGYMSALIAPLVDKLYCCDVSKSFLRFAKKECAGISNISFEHVQMYSFRFHFLADRSIDAVFAHNVFIHLSLYDIFWYLKEISRVVKPGGRVWFDIANVETFDLPNNRSFLEMAQHYKGDNIDCWPMLMQWNSPQAIYEIARMFGFRLMGEDLLQHDKFFSLVKE